MRTGLVLSIAMFCCCLAACNQTETPPIDVADAWVRKPIPPLDKTAGYFKIRNNTPSPVTLQKAVSPQARSIEFHETTREGDMTRMRRMSSLTIGPGEQAVFEPGGKHLMIFGFTEDKSLAMITLQFESGKTLDVPFELR